MFEIARETTVDQDMLAQPETRDAMLCGWRPLVEVLTELQQAGRVVGDPLTLAHLAWVRLGREIETRGAWVPRGALAEGWRSSASGSSIIRWASS